MGLGLSELKSNAIEVEIFVCSPSLSSFPHRWMETREDMRKR